MCGSSVHSRVGGLSALWTLVSADRELRFRVWVCGAAVASAAMPVISLTTAESLAESLLVKTSLACEQRAWAVKVSSASRALSKRKESKCERHTQGAGLKNRGRGFDIGL